MKNIHIGDRVSWESTAGTIRGEIVDIRLNRNADDELVPWLLVEHMIGNQVCYAVICGTDSYLKMVKLEVIYRDREKQAA